jgi:hypothetical protein
VPPRSFVDAWGHFDHGLTYPLDALSRFCRHHVASHLQEALERLSRIPSASTFNRSRALHRPDPPRPAKPVTRNRNRRSRQFGTPVTIPRHRRSRSVGIRTPRPPSRPQAPLAGLRGTGSCGQSSESSARTCGIEVHARRDAVVLEQQQSSPNSCCARGGISFIGASGEQSPVQASTRRCRSSGRSQPTPSS